jgi:hypothetical protein
MRRGGAAAFAGLLLGAAGCQSETVAIVENAQTGHRVDCRANPMAGDIAVQREICVRDFERRGYAVVPP